MLTARVLRGGRGLVLAGFILLLGVVLATSWFVARQERDNALLRHTLEVEGRLSGILSLLQDAETGQRGFLLTGEEAYLVPYREAIDALDGRLAALGAATADNPRQTDPLALLGRLAHAKLDELRTTIELRRRGLRAQVRQLVDSGAGKAIMDRARASIAQMKAEEERLFLERQARLERAGRWLQIGVVADIILMTGLGVVSVRATEHRASLQRFLPAEVAPRLASGDASLRQGRRQEVAILFIDMRGSTALAEDMDAERLSIFIASFRRRVMAAARVHGGVVDKFIGDGALVLFGIPDPRADDARRALACARRLLALVDRWNRKRGFPQPVRIGIGVHQGEVFCGVLGDAERLEFTVLGDPVNVAARLEQATKRLGQPILASRTVVAAASELEEWREVSRDPLPGRSEPLPILAPSTASPAPCGGGLS